jgi:hypothetical protein
MASAVPASMDGTHVAAHYGRIVETTGDGMLVEFRQRRRYRELCDAGAEVDDGSQRRQCD